MESYHNTTIDNIEKVIKYNKPILYDFNTLNHIKGKNIDVKNKNILDYSGFSWPLISYDEINEINEYNYTRVDSNMFLLNWGLKKYPNSKWIYDPSFNIYANPIDTSIYDMPTLDDNYDIIFSLLFHHCYPKELRTKIEYLYKHLKNNGLLIIPLLTFESDKTLNKYKKIKSKIPLNNNINFDIAESSNYIFLFNDIIYYKNIIDESNDKYIQKDSNEKFYCFYKSEYIKKMLNDFNLVFLEDFCLIIYR